MSIVRIDGSASHGFYMGLSDSLRHNPPNTTVSQLNDLFHIRFIGDCHRSLHCDFESTVQLYFWRISWHPFLGDPVPYPVSPKTDLSSTSSFLATLQRIP